MGCVSAALQATLLFMSYLTFPLFLLVTLHLLMTRLNQWPHPYGNQEAAYGHSNVAHWVQRPHA